MGIFQRLFNRQKELEPADLSVLHTDIHSHLIPGIDDGSPSLEESIKLIQGFVHLGYKKVITTPHIMSDYYRNTPEIINAGLATVRAEIQKQGIPIEIEAAAEYYVDEAFGKLVADDNLLSFGNRYILFELGFMAEAPNLGEVLFQLQLAGYKPVMAHPERYPYWLENPQKFVDFHDKGVLLQLNMNSLTGMYSPEVKRMGETLIDLGIVSFLGSDCHHGGHLDTMVYASKSPHLHKLLASGKLLNASL